MASGGSPCEIMSISCDHCSQCGLDLLSILLLFGGCTYSSKSLGSASLGDCEMDSWKLSPPLPAHKLILPCGGDNCHIVHNDQVDRFLLLFLFFFFQWLFLSWELHHLPNFECKICISLLIAWVELSQWFSMWNAHGNAIVLCYVYSHLHWWSRVE